MVPTMIRWMLGEVMARYNIKGKDLASALDVRNNTVSNLRNAKTMPRLDGDKLNDLLEELNKLADPDVLSVAGPIEVASLIQHVPEPDH